MSKIEYDIDKVVEQLKNAAYIIISETDEDGVYSDSSYKAISLYKAIQIVRGGGKDVK